MIGQINDQGESITLGHGNWKFYNDQGELLATVSGGGSFACSDLVGCEILDLGTAETDDTLVLAPDGVGGVEWRAETGGGGGSAHMWHPDFAPASAGAADDEFDGNSGGLPSGWTDWDHGSVETNVENKAGVLQTITASGVLGGMYKAIPSGDFTIWTKFNRLDYASQHIGALVLLEDGASSSGDLYTLGMDTSSFNLAVYSWNAYNSFGGVVAGGSATYDTKSVYFRIRRTGTTYSFDYSYNGILWVQRTSGSISFTPAHFGIAVYGTGGVALKANFQFFRYVASDIGVDGVAEGNRS